jgi:hypothetical protein
MMRHRFPSFREAGGSRKARGFGTVRGFGKTLSFGKTLLLGLTISANAQSSDPIVTSDSSEYCGVLMNRLTGMSRTATMPVPMEVASLSREGERMCVHGQTRGGILRLRKALAIMRNGED